VCHDLRAAHLSVERAIPALILHALADRPLRQPTNISQLDYTVRLISKLRAFFKGGVMIPTVAIRLATTDDAAAISDLILRALNEVNIRDYGPALIAEQSKHWTVDGVVAKMENRITYVAIADNDIVGTAGFDGQQARTVFVRPDRHKLGVGSLLMRARH
jgi:hypothetical protein